MGKNQEILHRLFVSPIAFDRTQAAGLDNTNRKYSYKKKTIHKYNTVLYVIHGPAGGVLWCIIRTARRQRYTYYYILSTRSILTVTRETADSMAERAFSCLNPLRLQSSSASTRSSLSSKTSAVTAWGTPAPTYSLAFFTTYVSSRGCATCSTQRRSLAGTRRTRRQVRASFTLAPSLGSNC